MEYLTNGKTQQLRHISPSSQRMEMTEMNKSGNAWIN